MDTCGIILLSITSGICLLGTGIICCIKHEQQQVVPNSDYIVITKEHYENLKKVGPPEYIGDPPVYDELPPPPPPPPTP
jgi:hypothetical protein